MRLGSLFVIIVLVMSFVFSASADGVFGPKFRFESSNNEIKISEPEFSHQFNSIDLFLTDIEDQFGYKPEYELDEENYTVRLWLYNSVVDVSVLIANDGTGVSRVIVPDIYFDDAVVEYNELYSTIGGDRFYDIIELESENYVLESFDPNNSRIVIKMYSKVDDKYIDLTIYEYKVDKAKILVSPQVFRQLWYELHKQDGEIE